jgi:Tfp pilus assembly protein PilX
MNKKIVTVIVVLLVLAIGAYGVYRVVKHFKRTSSPTSETEVQPSGSAETPSSLRDLIAKGISQSCTYSTDKSQGMIYLGDGKIRGDFNVTTVDADGQSQTTSSHMIIMNNTNYLWTEASSTGIKMSFDQNATPAPITSNTPTNSFDANALNNYKCSPWVIDQSLFTLPAGVNFRSFNLPSPAAVGSGAPSTGTNSSQCSYCDSLSGDSKAQCLSALNCK